MFPSFKREHTQIASFCFIVLAAAFIVLHPSGWKIAPVLGFVSLWIMVMCESVLLSRVQSEMGTALEGLRKKQEIEVQDLLFYLRQSELGNSPWSNIEAAKNHIAKLGLPAIITDSGGACLAVNDALTMSLGYTKDFIGELCHGLQRADDYGEYVHGIAKNISKGKRFMHSRLVMRDIEGDWHKGTVSIIMLPDMRTAVGIWLPDKSGILKSL
tara:strand:+ start:74 stop:712 length:639 start_codon:yes stop_codon:yes gene_type:complete